jgi:hypothetical protein
MSGKAQKDSKQKASDLVGISARLRHRASLSVCAV